ncbi:hypothetical protein GGQ54_001899 [Naumannella cuiyingiana]|uniref:DUF1707 domain-containing protein n=1 Tax=Naumannella cuiyingiana TaxID=1347891 RepID=A0A7Z0D9A2_9ACTN|nr:DUF1707 domain-containing protein [Naumannella cuiyingiana]NYI71339.1 hypothetical protein [Naumannella cuiyingiana]
MTDPARLPAKRIGDSERDEAVRLLTEHMSAGRIDSAEFDDRMSRALSARTMGDLDPLFADLPGARPDQQVVPSAPAQPPVPAPRDDTLKRVGQVIVALLWPAAIIAMIAFGVWWPILIPIFGSGAIAAAFGLNHGDRRPRDRERDRRGELPGGDRDQH